MGTQQYNNTSWKIQVPKQPQKKKTETTVLLFFKNKSNK